MKIAVSDEEAELDKYLSAKITLKEDVDPLTFWSTNTAYMSLAPAAQEILVVLASSAPV